MRPFLLLLTFMISTSCAMFERRDYEYQMSEFNYGEPLFLANRDFMTVAGDTGRGFRSDREINDRTPATARQTADRRYEMSLQQELRNIEMQISDAEYEEFDQYRYKIGGVSEQIYFLKLSPRERRAYLETRGIVKRKNGYTSSYQNNYARGAYRAPAGDVALGMSKGQVIETWGQPERRDIAGTISEGNERWAYHRGQRIKYIYFEGGQVEGWTEQ